MNKEEMLDILTELGRCMQKRKTKAMHKYQSYGGVENRDNYGLASGGITTVCAIAELFEFCTQEEMRKRIEEETT